MSRSQSAAQEQAATGEGPSRAVTHGGATSVVDAVPEPLRREFEDLGLSPYEARLLLAMMQLGPANTLHLAQVSGVPRTSTYPVLEALSAKHLAYRVPGEGPAIWACADRAEIFERLETAQEERLRQHRLRSERVRQMLDETIPESPPVVVPHVRLLYTAAENKETYQRLTRQAQSQILVFNRPPYTDDPPHADPAVGEMAARLDIRVLSAVDQLTDPKATAIRAAMQACYAAGVGGRVVEELPVKMAVFDRRVALVALSDSVPVEVGFPTVMLIEHGGFAAVLADAFEQRWASADPIDAT